jgi:hypothetical protein
MSGYHRVKDRNNIRIRDRNTMIRTGLQPIFTMSLSSTNRWPMWYSCGGCRCHQSCGEQRNCHHMRPTIPPSPSRATVRDHIDESEATRPSVSICTRDLPYTPQHWSNFPLDAITHVTPSCVYRVQRASQAESCRLLRFIAVSTDVGRWYLRHAPILVGRSPGHLSWRNIPDCTPSDSL